MEKPEVFKTIKGVSEINPIKGDYFDKLTMLFGISADNLPKEFIEAHKSSEEKHWRLSFPYDKLDGIAEIEFEFFAKVYDYTIYAYASQEYTASIEVVFAPIRDSIVRYFDEQGKEISPPHLTT